MITLSLKSFSEYGEQVKEEIQSNRKVLERVCNFADNEICNVGVEEISGERFEAMVRRPRPVTRIDDWSPTEPATAGPRGRGYPQAPGCRRSCDRDPGPLRRAS